jgi:5-oxoprolinase (ATP-hydrolysing) subunit A
VRFTIESETILSKPQRLLMQLLRSIQNYTCSFLILKSLSQLPLMAGLTVIHEFFADRAYLPEGTLVPRTVADSVLHDADQISERVLSWLEHGSIAASDGSQIVVAAESICLHGDTPGAVASAASIYQRCKAAGYEIKSWMDN